MSWLGSTEKRSQQFIARRTASRGARFALPLILQNCWSDRCTSSHRRLLTVPRMSPTSMDWVIVCDTGYREWPTSRLVSVMAIFMGAMPVRRMVLSRSMTSTAAAGAIEPTIWPSFRGLLQSVKIPPSVSRQWVVPSSKGYARRRRLGPADVDAIAAFVAIRQIWLLGLHIGSGDRFGWGWINDSYFDGQLKVLRDWEKNWLSRSSAVWLKLDAE